ncbi:MAG: hypothetical protein R6U70_10655 [Bacillota bacterium]
MRSKPVAVLLALFLALGAALWMTTETAVAAETEGEDNGETEENDEICSTDIFGEVELTWTSEFSFYGVEDEGDCEFVVSVCSSEANEDSVTIVRTMLAEEILEEDLSVSIEPGECAEIPIEAAYELVEVDEEIMEAALEFFVVFHVGEDDEDEYQLLIEVFLTNADPEEPVDEEGGRSEVARAVHRALTGQDGLWPGDEGFGHAVSVRARECHLGSIVSQAAREANGSSDKGNGKSNGKAKGKDK